MSADLLCILIALAAVAVVVAVDRLIADVPDSED